MRDFISNRINRLRLDRKWSVYKLAQESMINAQTIHNWLEHRALPTIENVSSICEAFGISLANFFSNGELIETSPELKILYHNWCALTPDEKNSIEAIIKNYLDK